MVGPGAHSEAAEGRLSWLRLGSAVETCGPGQTCSRTGRLKRPCEGRGRPGCRESADCLGPCSSRPVEVRVSSRVRLAGLELCHLSPLQGRLLVGSLYCPKTLPGRGSGLYPGASSRLEVEIAPLAWTYSHPTVSGKTLLKSRPLLSFPSGVGLSGTLVFHSQNPLLLVPMIPCSSLPASPALSSQDPLL